jgi:PAS domain S-box-containing protein
MGRAKFGWRECLRVALAAVLLAAGIFSFARRINGATPELGVQWVQSAAGPLAVNVAGQSAAELAGIRVGDFLVAVDGEPIQAALDAAQLGWRLRGEAVSLELRRDGVALMVSVRPIASARAEPYGYLAVVGLAFWLAGLFISLRWSRVRGGAIFSMLAMALFSQFVLSHTGRGDLADRWIYALDVLAGAFVPALLLHLAIAVASKKNVATRRWTLLGYTVSTAVLLVTAWLSPEGLGGAYLFENPVGIVELSDRLEPLALALSLVITCIILSRGYQRFPSGLRRTQIRWLLRGALFGLAPFVLLYHLPWALGATELPRWAQFASVIPLLFTPAAFTAALARYRLNDLDLLLMRALNELFSIFCAFAVYAIFVFVLREALGDLFDISKSATRYVGLLGMAVTYPAVRRWVRVGVEKAFYRKRYSYRSTLLDWARELSAETDLQPLLSRLRRRVCETLGVADADVLVRTGPTRFGSPGESRAAVVELDDDEVAQLRDVAVLTLEPGRFPSAPWARHLFAMKVKGRTRALLAVGDRPAPEEPLNSEDRALLGTLAAHAATAIEAARLVGEVRHRANEIERLHARQAKILESSAVGLLLLDSDGTLQAWNRALEEIYGLSRAEALGRCLTDVFPLHVVRRLELESRETSTPSEPRIFRLSLVNRRGERIVVNLSVSAVEDEPGVDASRVVTFDDVSARVKLEEQVLRQERLASLGLLAAGVAHEINTPLTGISSYAQMLLEDCAVDDPRRQTLAKIEKQTQRATDITRSLLNLARPEETVFEPIDCAATVSEVVQLFEPQTRCRNIELTIDVAEDLPRVPGHKGKLQQVLLNLLMNARDAVEGGGEIKLRGRHQGGTVTLEVEDNGVGIADEDLDSIFDPFFTTKGRGRGTGLGLSISYGIVREHDGEIHVESRPGEYTRFYVELPVRPGAQATA